MRKLSFTLFIIACVSFIFVACSNTESKADTPDGFELVQKTEIEGDTVIEMRHKKTGCHYVMVGYGATTTTEQMMVDAPGTGAMPYCTED